ncbi:Molecular chaperone Hsp31 and glyoxalase 3 [Klebsiella pneumoniae]|nr:Molecular chaperone Hsp31 and glyoxalase 3 [Klebsiella pneumoniae]
MPGHLTWKFGEQLKSIGFEIVNTDISGATCQDRKMLTGDSPLAGNALGQLAAKALLSEVSKELRHAAITIENSNSLLEIQVAVCQFAT